MKQLRVVNLQQHAGNLAGQAGMHVLDQWKQTLTCRSDGEDLERNAINPQWHSGTSCFTQRNGRIQSGFRESWRSVTDVGEAYPASAFVPVVEQQPAWRRSKAPVPERGPQA